MKRKGLLVAFGALLAIGGTLLMCQYRSLQKAPSGAEPEPGAHLSEEPLNPLLQTLLGLSTTGDETHQSPFFTTLTRVAQEQGWASPDWCTDAGRAVLVQVGQTKNAVVILGG